MSMRNGGASIDKCRDLIGKEAAANDSREFEERAAIESFRFRYDGESIRGRLVAIDVKRFPERTALLYIVEESESNRLLSILETADLSSKIRSSDIGKVLEIRFEGFENVAYRRPMKRYRVRVLGSG